MSLALTVTSLPREGERISRPLGEKGHTLLRWKDGSDNWSTDNVSNRRVFTGLGAEEGMTGLKKGVSD